MIDPGGYQWLPTIPLAQNNYFRLTAFQVPNFRGRFEALNDVFWASPFYFINVLLDGTFPTVSRMTQMEIVCKSYAPGKLGDQFTTSG